MLRIAVLGLAFGLTLLAGTKISKKAQKIHNETLVFDGHNDLPWQLFKAKDSDLTKTDLRKIQKKLHTDIPRLRAGNLGAQFWSAYVPASTMHDGTALRRTMEQIDIIHRMVEKYPDVFEFAYSTEDISRIRRSGKVASMIGVEGGYSMDSSLGVLRVFHRLGVRYMTLTHSQTINWADSATDMSKHNGLTKFGKKVIAEMNRLGMLIDISHVSKKTMKDAIETSKVPVMASHSSAYAIAKHDRNVPDDVLRMIKKKDGVIMVNFYSGYLVPEGAKILANIFQVERDLMKKHKDPKAFKAALADWRKKNPIPQGDVKILVDHMDHIKKIAGVKHIGLGSDYDGVPVLPEGLEDVSTYPLVTQELLNRGYTKEEIALINGGNIMRVLKKAEDFAKKQRALSH